MASDILKEILGSISEEEKIFMRNQSRIVFRINQILKEKKLTQKKLAEKLDKQPSEISKWLKGNHNFTLKSLAKLEAELGEEIISVPQQRTFTVSDTHKVSMTVYTETRSISTHFTPSEGIHIKKETTPIEYGKVG